MRNVISTILSAIFLAGLCGCGGSRSPLTQPSSTALTGTWVGTLSRPDGLPPITVRWVTTQSGVTMTGPMTLTNGNGSVTFNVPGQLSGNKDGYDFMLDLPKAGPSTDRPDCRLVNTNAPPTAKGLREPVTAITTDPFGVAYNRCDGFVDPPPQRTQLIETAQLTITKQ